MSATMQYHLLLIIILIAHLSYETGGQTEKVCRAADPPSPCTEERRVSLYCEHENSGPDVSLGEIRFTVMKSEDETEGKARWETVPFYMGGNLSVRAATDGGIGFLVSKPQHCCNNQASGAVTPTTSGAKWGIQVEAKCGEDWCIKQYLSADDAFAGSEMATTADSPGFLAAFTTDCAGSGPPNLQITVPVSACGKTISMVKNRIADLYKNAEKTTEVRDQPDCHSEKYQHANKYAILINTTLIHVECENQEIPSNFMIHLDESDRGRHVDHGGDMYHKSFLDLKPIGNTCYEAEAMRPIVSSDNAEDSPNKFEWYFHAEAYCGSHRCALDTCIDWSKSCVDDNTKNERFCRAPERLTFTANQCGPAAESEWRTRQEQIQADAAKTEKERCSSALYYYGVVSVHAKCSTEGERCGCLISDLCGGSEENPEFGECNKESLKRLSGDCDDNDFAPDPIVNVKTAHEYDCLKHGEPFPWVMLEPFVITEGVFIKSKNPSSGKIINTESFYLEASAGDVSHAHTQVFRLVQDRNVGKKACAKLMLNIADYDFDITEVNERKKHMGHWRDSCRTQEHCLKPHQTTLTTETWNTIELPLPGDRVRNKNSQSEETIETNKPFLLTKSFPAKVNCIPHQGADLPMVVEVKLIVMHVDAKWDSQRNTLTRSQDEQEVKNHNIHVCVYNKTDDLSSWTTDRKLSITDEEERKLFLFARDNIEYHSPRSHPIALRNVDFIPHLWTYYKNGTESESEFYKRRREEAKEDYGSCYKK